MPQCCIQHVGCYLRGLLLLVAVLPAGAENYVRLDSAADGKSYTVDTDQGSVQRALRPVDKSTAASHLPDWLFPGAGAEAENPGWDPMTGTASAFFRCGGTVDQVAAFYDQTFRSRGLRTSSVLVRGTDGRQLTGYNDSITASVQIQTQSGDIRVHASYAPRTTSRRHFDVVWYDDIRGVLRLRDTTGGGEYELDKQGIIANNLNRPGGVAAQGAGMPSWLPRFPGASVSPKGRITWLFTPTAEFTTGEPIRKVYDYYMDAVQTAGATVVSSGINRSGVPLREIGGQITAQRGDDQVDIRVGEVVWMGMGKGQQTGIGIRYTVPKR